MIKEIKKHFTTGMIAGVGASLYGAYSVASNIAGYAVKAELSPFSYPSDATEMAIKNLYIAYQANAEAIKAAAAAATKKAFEAASSANLPFTVKSAIEPSLKLATQMGMGAYGLIKTNLYVELGVYAVVSTAVIYTGHNLYNNYYDNNKSFIDNTSHMMGDGIKNGVALAANIGLSFYASTVVLGRLLSAQTDQSFQARFDSMKALFDIEAYKPMMRQFVQDAANSSASFFAVIKSTAKSTFESLKSHDYLASARAFLTGSFNYVAARPVAFGLPAVALTAAVVAYNKNDSFKKRVDQAVERVTSTIGLSK